MRNCQSYSRAFSLVELSIVLVILGLLVGGILAGQSLIRASELRAVSTEYARYQAAINAFRDKYFQLPGDMNNAESFWGKVAVADTDCRDTLGADTKTCNGDGDGNVETVSTRSREIFAFWKQLANAGLIEGSYSNTSNGGAWRSTGGVNVPVSKLSNAGWTVVGRSDIVTQAGWYTTMFPPSNSTNWLEFGTPGDALTQIPALRNEEAWNIDTKLDDGRPGTGIVTTYNVVTHANCASSNTASIAIYQLSVTSLACTLNMGL